MKFAKSVYDEYFLLLSLKDVSNAVYSHLLISFQTRIFLAKIASSVYADYLLTENHSIYLPEMQVSLFPAELSQKVMSILANQRNYALTFSAKLHEDGTIAESEIKPSILTNVHRTDYESVDELLSAHYDLANSPSRFSSEQSEALIKLSKWAAIRRKFRLTKGANMIHLPQPEIYVENGRIVEFKIANLFSRSRSLVEEMMVLGGEIAATYASTHSIPVPFRNQHKPVETPIDPNLPELVKAFQLIRTMSPAFYNVQNLGHVGIGLPYYTRTTSPIRRYTDIITHFQIKSHLRGENPPFAKDQLANLLERVEHRTLEIKHLQKNSLRFWLRQYILQKEEHQSYEATVISIPQNFGRFPLVEVWIPSLGHKSKIFVTKEVMPGDSVTVLVDKVDSHDIFFKDVDTVSETTAQFVPVDD